MSHSASIVAPSPLIFNHPSSRFQTIGFAIAIIIGIGDLVITGVGLMGYLQVSSFSHLSKIHSITHIQLISMMAVVGGGGLLLLIIGIMGSIKNCQRNTSQQRVSGMAHLSTQTGDVGISSPLEELIGVPEMKKDEEAKRGNGPAISEVLVLHGGKIDKLKGLVYGQEAWLEIWKVEIKDDVIPPPPPIPWNEEDPYFGQPFRDNYVLLYIPHTIQVKEGKEKEFTLNTLREISDIKYKSLFPGACESIMKDFLISPPVSSGWVLMSKQIIPASRGKKCNDLKTMVEAHKNFDMPNILETAVLILMVHAFHNKEVYLYPDGKPETFTRCLDEVMLTGQTVKYPVVVGSFSSEGLCFDSYLSTTIEGEHEHVGVGVVQRFKAMGT